MRTSRCSSRKCCTGSRLTARDAQALQVGDGRVRGQAGVGAALGFGHAGVQLAEAAHVHFVEHAVRPGCGRRGIALPVEAVVHHARLQRQGAVVARIHAQRVVAGLAAVPVAPLEAADDLARTGVEQQLVRVEAMPVLRLPRAVRAQAVDQAGAAPPRWPCQTSPLRAGSIRRAVSVWPVSSYRHSSMAVACAENTAKFTPAASTLAPSGQGWPWRSVAAPATAPIRTSRWPAAAGRSRSNRPCRCRPRVRCRRRPAPCRRCCRRSAANRY